MGVDVNQRDIRMIALDLDGTTLNSEGRFTAATKRAFIDALNCGIHIVISTGRTFSSLPNEIFEIPGLEYVVTSNGAHITEMSSKKTIYEDYIDAGSIMEIVYILSSAGYSVEAFTDGRAYMDEKEYNEILNYGSKYRDVSYVLNTRNPVKDIFKYLKDNNSRIENININFESFEDKERLRAILKNVKNITLTTSYSHNLEIGGKHTSKAQALRYLLNLLKISPEHLLACGDSPNDIQMLRLAGVGVAVANATDDVKEVADLICEENDKDGVAKVIEKYIKKTN